MPESFFQLSAKEKAEALQAAASASGRPAHLLEKDVWVVWALSALFESPLGEHLVFKGGTALSKAYRAIRRFSEDVDLTYDIRVLAPDLVGNAPEGMDAIPPSRSQEKKWSDAIRKELLPAWLREHAHPVIQNGLKAFDKVTSRVTEGCIFIEYTPIVPASSYALPRVMLEFGARATGEPSSVHTIECDMAEHISAVSFPTAHPRVMDASRIFWEKATAAHVYCAQGKEGLSERFSRHFHDLVRLKEAGYLDKAMAAKDIAEAVAIHKGAFFVEKDLSGNRIDYTAAVHGSLVLTPDGEAKEALNKDYQKMVDDGLLFDEAEPFEHLIEECRDIQEQINKPYRRAALSELAEYDQEIGI